MRVTRRTGLTALLLLAAVFSMGHYRVELPFYALSDSQGGAALTGDSATAFFSTGTIEAARLPADNGVKDVTILTPTTADASMVQLTFPEAVTITRVWCSTDTGTATIQFDERAEATPNTAGTDVLTSPLVCDATSEATTSFANATIALRVPMNLDIDATSGTPGVVRIHVEW